MLLSNRWIQWIPSPLLGHSNFNCSLGIMTLSILDWQLKQMKFRRQIWKLQGTLQIKWNRMIMIRTFYIVLYLNTNLVFWGKTIIGKINKNENTYIKKRNQLMLLNSWNVYGGICWFWSLPYMGQARVRQCLLNQCHKIRLCFTSILNIIQLSFNKDLFWSQLFHFPLS